MIDFFNNNASAVFGLIGALGGAILSFLGTWVISNRKYKLENWRILSERRIKAHEDLIELALNMREMHLIGGIHQNGDVRRAPNVLASKDAFQDWLYKFGSLVNAATTWITIDAKREAWFVQDYFITLSLHLERIGTDSYPDVGEIIRQDFIDLSQRLEEKAYKFFRKEIHQLKISDIRKWHKYPRKYTEGRLAKTLLLTSIDKIRAFEEPYVTEAR